MGKFGGCSFCYNSCVIPSPPSNPLKVSKQESFFRQPWFWALLSCFLFIILLGARYILDLDLGFHLKGGQWIIQNHCVPSQDTYTYTVTGRDYLDIHWLYQVLLYLLYLAGGYTLLSVFNITLIVTVFVITFIRTRSSGAPAYITVPLLALAVYICEHRFQVRPEILSWVFLGGMLYVLERNEKGKKGLLFLLPLIQVLWANVEGLFVLGWAVMVIFLVSGLIHRRKLDKKLMVYSGLSFAASLLNPNFFRGMAYPFTNWNTMRSEAFSKNIVELMSPWGNSAIQPMPDGPTLAYKLFSLFLLILVLATLRRRKAHELLMAAAFFWFSSAAARNVPIFLLACLPLAASCWTDLGWARLKGIMDNLFSKPLPAWLAAALLLGLCLRIVTNAYYTDGARQETFGLGVNGENQPLGAVDFLVKNHLDGRILNSLNSGGWLEWQGPQKVFMDGRLEVMGEDFFSEYIHSQAPGGALSMAEKYGADILFFSPEVSRQWVSDLRKTEDWRPVYLDGFTVIYLRKGYAPQVPALDENRLMVEYGIPEGILAQAPALMRLPRHTAWDAFWEGFYKNVNYSPGLYRMGTFFLLEKRPQAAEVFFLEAIRRSEGLYNELYNNLGVLYYFTGRSGEARLCIQKVLENDRGNESAKKMLQMLPASP